MRNLCILLIIHTVFFCMANAKPLELDDFAYHATLSDAKSSLRQLWLPLSVYQNMQRHDYGDLRVFSADGQVVPHQIIHPTSAAKTQLSALPFYPFSQQQAANPANIRVIIDQHQRREQLDIHQQLNQEQSTKQHEFQYIIENLNADGGSLSKHKQTLCTLLLEWEQPSPSMILQFSLDSSDNLQNWISRGRSFSVSKLSYAGAQLVSNTVNLTCITDKYLRLTWLKPKQQVHLSKVSGVHSTAGEQKLQWKSFAKPIDDKAGNWLFESDVMARLSQMEFDAPQDGMLYQGRLYSRNDRKSPWRYRKNITQYRLTVGETNLKSSAFFVAQNNDRYWKFEPGYEGRLNENQLPEIRGGWQQEQLLFLAQGNQPFQLAYGNPTIAPLKNSGLTTLKTAFEDTGAIPDLVNVAATQENKNMHRTEIDMPWKKIGLWALLLFGTALLAYMALSLYRQMDNKN